MQFGDCHKHCAGLVDWLIDLWSLVYFLIGHINDVFIN